jgi:Ca2+:H+ antiporter
VIPAAYHAAKRVDSSVVRDFMAAKGDGSIPDLNDKAQRGLLVISHGTAVLLLGVYLAYLIFQLKTHTSLFVTRKRRWILSDDDTSRAQMSIVAASLG